MTRRAQERAVTQVGPEWYHLLAGPGTWSVYFLVVYVLGEFGCVGGWLAGTLAGLPAASAVVIGLTVLALAVLGLAALRTYRRRQRLPAAGGHERSHFMLGAALLLDGLFLIAIGYTGLPALVLAPCSVS